MDVKNLLIPVDFVTDDADGVPTLSLKGARFFSRKNLTCQDHRQATINVRDNRRQKLLGNRFFHAFSMVAHPFNVQ
ncbi:hypothetical protein D3C79_988570 [compost metagenome]